MNKIDFNIEAEKGHYFPGLYYDVIDIDGNVIATGVPGISGDDDTLLIHTTLLINKKDIVDGKIKLRHNDNPF